MDSKQAKPAAVAAKKELNGKCSKAYEHWVKHPYLRLIDLGDKFAVSPDAIRYWVKKNGHSRPDGKDFRPVVSERKQAIIDAYNDAVKQGKDICWAVERANEGRASRSVNKGDFTYYAVKNNLPELPSGKPQSDKYIPSSKYG